MRRDQFGDAVGQEEFIFLFPDGTKTRVGMRVGKPYSVGERDWACPCELTGLDGRHPDIRGGSSMQALTLAISLLRRRVEDFIEKGGKVLDAESEEEYPFAGIWATFGAVGLNRAGAP